MSKGLWLPAGYSYRELWLPELISDENQDTFPDKLPSSVPGGHALTLTGARKGTTTDGVHFTGSATSNMVVGAAAGQNNQAAFHITIRFKLDSTFAAGAAAPFFLFYKLADANNFMYVALNSVDGKLQFVHQSGGAQVFLLDSTTVSWVANTWYTITVSFTDGPVQRMLVNGTLEDSSAVAAANTPNGGDIIIGSSSDGSTDGIIGTISWVVIGVGATATVALTAAEETDLAKGIPPAGTKVMHHYLMDEGRGTIVYDQGSIGNQGVLDSACTWVYSGPKLPVMSLDGLYDYGISGATDIIGAVTAVWVAKMKSTYVSLGADRAMFRFQQALASDILLASYGTGFMFGGILTPSSFAIDDYGIFILTDNPGSNIRRGFINGVQVGTTTSTARTGTAQFYLGDDPYNEYDISKPILAGLINGALTPFEAHRYSRYLDQRLGLGLRI